MVNASVYSVFFFVFFTEMHHLFRQIVTFSFLSARGVQFLRSVTGCKINNIFRKANNFSIKTQKKYQFYGKESSFIQNCISFFSFPKAYCLRQNVTFLSEMLSECFCWLSLVYRRLFPLYK